MTTKERAAIKIGVIDQMKVMKDKHNKELKYKTNQKPFIGIIDQLSTT